MVETAGITGAGEMSHHGPCIWWVLQLAVCVDMRNCELVAVLRRRDDTSLRNHVCVTRLSCTLLMQNKTVTGNMSAHEFTVLSQRSVLLRTTWRHALSCFVQHGVTHISAVASPRMTSRLSSRPGRTIPVLHGHASDDQS